MAVLYNGSPQIKIGSNWSYDKWGVFLAKGWSLDPPMPKTTMVNIPAADGALDLTDVLAGEPRYQNRNISFGLVFTMSDSGWEPLRETIENYCSGQRMNITLPHDANHYLTGRISSGSFDRQNSIATLNFTASCDPWRYKNKQTITSFVLPVAASISGNLRNERRRVIPSITTDGSISVTINNITESMSAGTFSFTNFLLNPGNNPVTITGPQGTNVSFTYQEASL